MLFRVGDAKTPITIEYLFSLISYLTEIVLLNGSDRKLNSPFSFVMRTGAERVYNWIKKKTYHIVRLYSTTYNLYSHLGILLNNFVI